LGGFFAPDSVAALVRKTHLAKEPLGLKPIDEEKWECVTAFIYLVYLISEPIRSLQLKAGMGN
jgi:hypothetical protein